MSFQKNKSGPITSINRCFEKGVSVVFRPLPLPVLNFFLGKIVNNIGKSRPEIFDRLEGHHHKIFLIIPTNIPFAFCLYPDPIYPRLKAFRKKDLPSADSIISGSFLTLLGMIDGRYDGDSIFFMRALRVEGDTEAVVCLRNALDNINGTIAEDVAGLFGVSGKTFLEFARGVSSHVHTA